MLVVVSWIWVCYYVVCYVLFDCCVFVLCKVVYYVGVCVDVGVFVVVWFVMCVGGLCYFWCYVVVDWYYWLFVGK